MLATLFYEWITRPDSNFSAHFSHAMTQLVFMAAQLTFSFTTISPSPCRHCPAKPSTRDWTQSGYRCDYTVNSPARDSKMRNSIKIFHILLCCPLLQTNTRVEITLNDIFWMIMMYFSIRHPLLIIATHINKTNLFLLSPWQQQQNNNNNNNNFTALLNDI